MPLDRDELLALTQDSLDDLAGELGLLVASALLEDEVTRLYGALNERRPGRAHTRYGRHGGVVILGRQKLPVVRPRCMASTRRVRLADERRCPILLPRPLSQETAQGSAHQGDSGLDRVGGQTTQLPQLS